MIAYTFNGDNLCPIRASPRPDSSPLTSTLFSETQEPSLASLTSPAESIYAVSSYVGGGGPGSIAISVKLVMVAHISITLTRGMQKWFYRARLKGGG